MPIIFLKKFLCFSNFKPPLPPIPSPPDHTHPSPLPSLFIKNFNSLFHQPSDSFSDSDSPPPDFATVFASQRFFFSSPGHSNSIIDSPSSPPHSDKLLNGGIAVSTFSPDPYMDFLRSMREMVEAREPVDLTSDWKYLHELLLCYLTINPNDTHKYIVCAFSDLLVGLLSGAGKYPKLEDSGRFRRHV